MRLFLAVLFLVGAALAQTVVKGLTPAELEAVLKQSGIPYEKTGAQEYRVEMAGLKKVWLYWTFARETGAECSA